MEHIQIQTAQNVALEYETASVGDRILAVLVDYVILATYLTSALSAAFKFDAFTTTLVVIVMIPFLLYEFITETLLNGQTPGKRLLKIKVIKTDGSQPTIGDYFLRWLLRLVDVSISNGAVAVITILINGKGQRLGDLAAGTTVIKLKPRVTLQDTLFKKVEDTYVPTFPQVVNLTDRDVTVLKEVIELNRREREALPALLAIDKRLREVMNVQSEMNPFQFTTTVLKDYNYYTGKI
ncbi:MAG TPA: RDD family protein [Patescibacteria group bacterium]|nr:RDD family protein [Patescibacteria group bacterium]